MSKRNSQAAKTAARERLREERERQAKKAKANPRDLATEVVSMEEGVHTLRVVEAILASAASGRTITL